MALRLIRQANETVRLDVTQGTGWQPATRGKFDASVNAYPELATIQAVDCTGLRVYDYDAPGQPFWESTTGTRHALTVIKTGRRLAVRAENTTDKTEVIMHVVPIPPPCFVERLRAWRGVCHGAKTDWCLWWRGMRGKLRQIGRTARLHGVGHNAGTRNVGKRQGIGDPSARLVQVPPVGQRESGCLTKRGRTVRRCSTSHYGHGSTVYRHDLSGSGCSERTLQGGQAMRVSDGTHTNLTTVGVGA